MKIEGKQVELNEGEMDMIEETLAYKHILDKLFKRLIQETSETYLKERKMWKKFESIAMEQFPEFDKNKHLLSWNWQTSRMIVQLQEDRDKGLVG